MHNNGIKKPPAPRYSVTGDIDADSSAPKSQELYRASASPFLPMFGDTFVIEGSLIFEM